MINCNNSVFKKSFLTLLFFMSFIFADPTDGCELETNQVYLTDTGDVLYNSDTDIAGFQFSVEGTTASGAAGGSAADALHITGELVGKFLIDRKAININCLNANVSVLTAWANDFSFDTVFERQIEAYGSKGGVCWGLSTSGNSINVINGFIKAKKLGMSTLAFTGKDGGELKKFSDLIICIPSSSTPRIQEVHLIVYHYICEQLEILQLNKG